MERLSETVVRLALANGHRLVGHVGRRERAWVAGLAVGDRVAVRLSPADFSAGRMVVGKRWERRVD